MRRYPMNYKAKKPKRFYILPSIPIISDTMKHQRLIDMTFREAVINGYDNIKQEMFPTTVMLPVWMRREVSIINLDTDITQGNIYTAMVHHGTALLQEMTNPYTTNLHNDLRTLMASDNSIVVGIVQNLAASTNDLEGGARRSLRIPSWCKNKLGLIGGHLQVNYSSLIRMSMCMSIQRYDDILKKDRTICNKEITKFEAKMVEYAHVCHALAAAETPTDRGG